jgi:hypothetical protein
MLNVSHGKHFRQARLEATCEFESPTSSKTGGRKLSELVKQSLLPRQTANKYAPSGRFFVSTPQFAHQEMGAWLSAAV